MRLRKGCFMRKIIPCSAEGIVQAPASKSMMQRAIAAALLSQGTSEISNPSFCRDAVAAMGIARNLGAEIEEGKKSVVIKGGLAPKKKTLKCVESGLSMRMFTPIAALLGKEMTLTGSGTLLSRPVGMIENPLMQLGVKCTTNNSFPPIKVRGPLGSGKANVDGSESSQFLSGLLLSLPLCRGDSEVIARRLKSKQYVEMTLEIAERFGVKIVHDPQLRRFEIEGGQEYRAANYMVEGDWSGAAFMLAAGAISGKVTVTGLDIESRQPDIAVLEALRNAGAKVTSRSGKITAGKSALSGFEFDATSCPDLFPPLVALACNCKGKTILRGTGRLVHKESNRAEALVQEFRKIGAKIVLKRDAVEVRGSKLKGGIVDSHNDHRVAMALAVAGLGSGKGVAIRNDECVSKSYPDFFSHVDRICRGGALG